MTTNVSYSGELVVFVLQYRDVLEKANRLEAIDRLEFDDDRAVMTARVPLAAMFGYATT